MRNTASVLIIASVISCTPVDATQKKNDAAKPAAASVGGGNKNDGGPLASSTSASLSVASASVTRHLPGTAITTASGKYVYLVKSDGTAAPFASSALAAASGYPASMVVTVSAAELYCYGSGNAIASALPAPLGGKLRDGSLVKEKGKTDTYAISDGVAWPIRNGAVFSSAGYDFANVTELPAGSLAGKVEAVGNCVQGVACLDEEYLASCAKEVIGDLVPTAMGTSTATDISAPPSSTAASTGTATAVRQPDADVMRHLPGTAITTVTGKYIYLVQEGGMIAPFATAAIAAASGYPAAMVITVSAEELYCYSRGEPITAPLPAAPSGKFHEGALVKENGKTDTYVISGGSAWPIISGAVFVEAGYSWDNVAIIPAGTLADKVDAVGNCVSRISCLDEEYLLACGGDEMVDPLPTATATATATATTLPTAINTAIATVIATSAPIATATSAATATEAAETAVHTAIATAFATQASTATATTVATSVPATVSAAVVATDTQTSVATNVLAATATLTVTSTNTAAATPDAGAVTVTATATATGTGSQQQAAIDLSWVYGALGAKLCLNAAYFAGGNKAVLLIWTGPGADAAKGTVVTETAQGFCWSFSGKAKGLYYFWADVPDPSCASDTCPRDAVSDNGAMYMTAPKASPSSRKWLHCEPTGCDGAAYWDGSSFTPMGD